ncbi:SCO family protein [Metabacillus herbersteinensis]|uniref:SCO family protein n=1 Tax=Metabacillus herbersteinensis TaxID=283816 RepID=A0ABV6GE86_9BACI
MKKLILALFLTVFLTACGQSVNLEEHFSLSGQVEPLQAVNQDGESVKTADYKDSVWLAAFIFTNCDTVCSPMTAHMAKLQQQIKDKNLDVNMVSFSVDPDNDTKAVVKTFGEQFGADFTNWDFLTGYDQAEIETFSNKGFMAPAAKVEGSSQFVHSTNIYLIKGNTILEQYDGVSDVPYDKIIEDIKLLN